MPRTSASYAATRPNAATLHPRLLTSRLGKASTLPELLSLHQTHGSQFNGFHVGAFWSRFKKLARGELGGLSHRLVPMCEQTVRILPELKAREVATIAHAFAKSRLVGSGPYQGVWVALEEVARRRLGDFNAQGLSMTAWAFATAGHASPGVFDALAAEVVRRGLGDFNQQNLSNTAWAFAKANRAAPALFNVISAEVVQRGLGDFNAQGLVNTAWAFAKAGRAAPELFRAISAEAVRRRLGGFNEQNCSNTAWAFATMGHGAPEKLPCTRMGTAASINGAGRIAHLPWLCPRSAVGYASKGSGGSRCAALSVELVAMFRRRCRARKDFSSPNL